MIDDALDLERADARAVVWTDGDVLRVAGHLAPSLRAPGWAASLPAFVPDRQTGIAAPHIPSRRVIRWRCAWTAAGVAAGHTR
jgi:hypothetical protein